MGFFGIAQKTSSVAQTASESSPVVNMDVNLDGDKNDTVDLISNHSELLWLSENFRDNGSAWSQQKIFL